MKYLLIGVAAAAIITTIGPVSAQVRPYGAPQPWPPAYLAQSYPFPALTPEDAYRQGLINRWQLEQYAGPLPQALQGPSVDGTKGSQDGGKGGD